MAQSTTSNAVRLAAIAAVGGVGAYLVWRWWHSGETERESEGTSTQETAAVEGEGDAGYTVVRYGDESSEQFMRVYPPTGPLDPKFEPFCSSHLCRHWFHRSVQSLRPTPLLPSPTPSPKCPTKGAASALSTPIAALLLGDFVLTLLSNLFLSTLASLLFFHTHSPSVYARACIVQYSSIALASLMRAIHAAASETAQLQ